MTKMKATASSSSPAKRNKNLIMIELSAPSALERINQPWPAVQCGVLQAPERGQNWA
jgi:hypothetical protein